MQEGTDFEPFAATLLAQQPVPPREVAWRTVLIKSRRTSQAILPAFGLVMVVIGAFVVSRQGELLAVPMGTIICAMGVLAVIAPVVRSLRVTSYLRRGERATARVVELHYQGQESIATIDARESGIARGRWQVTCGGREETRDFETDAVWAGQLALGSEVTVLVSGSGVLPLFLSEREPSPDDPQP